MGDDKEDKGDAGALRGWFIVPSRCSTMEEESGLTVGGESDTVIGDSAKTCKTLKLIFFVRLVHLSHK